MCTVTWTRHGDEYSLFCNRDERSSRRPALGPQVSELRGVKYIAPIDGDHGGSWIAVNEFGLSLCLLNRYGDMQLDENRTYVSRGLLLIGLIDSRNPRQVIDRIDEFDLSRFPPFNLLVLARDSELLLEWTGSKYSINSEPRLPLTSTSLAEPGIAVARAAQFRSLVSAEAPSSSLLEKFHRSHLPQRGPVSVCMHREGANTVSLSKVSVTKSGIVFEYEPGSPCEATAAQITRLENGM